jgi:hypothetical protein
MQGLINMTPTMASTLAFVETQAAARTNVTPTEADAEDSEPPPLVPLYSLNNSHIPHFVSIQRHTQVADINGVD